MSQHKTPCYDCPWRRAACPGWLGSLSAAKWLSAVNSESEIQCHTRPPAQCAGAAIYRSNVSKRPRDKTLLLLPKDTRAVFASPVEFMEHHEGENVWQAK